MNLTKSIRLVLTETDKQLLASIAEQDSSTSMSAIIRRLIRDEAQQRGIVAVSQSITNQSDSAPQQTK